MVTKTVPIADAREGDTFTGTVTTTEDATYTITGPLTKSDFGGRRLYILSSLDYIDSPSWTNVTVTREVTAPTEPGYYQADKYPIADRYNPYYLDRNGKWYEQHDNGGRQPIDNIERYLPMSRLVPEVTS